MFGTKAPPVTLAVPGCQGQKYLDDGSGTPDADDLLFENEDATNVRIWASLKPKQFLTGGIVVGTIDQVLLSALRVGHAHLRASSLARLLLVIDEVHDSDTYMTTLTKAVMDRHVASGGYALCMSATLGSRTRKLLLGTKGRIPLSEAMALPYPLITPVGQTPVTIKGPGKQKTIKVQFIPHNPDTLGSLVRKHIDEGAKIAVICNTVRDCIQVQRTIEQYVPSRNIFQLQDTPTKHQGILIPHHARFSEEARGWMDTRLEKCFGGPNKRTLPLEGMVVVATQTIQQSLDLDFDVVFTVACPMDVLLQRLGRGLRHDRDPEERPEGCRDSLLAYFIIPEDGLSIIKQKDAGKLGWGTVYPKWMVETTWRVLEKHPVLTIPEDNRMLVESAQHQEAFQTLVLDHAPNPKVWKAWNEDFNKFQGGESGDRVLAQDNIILWNQPYATMQFPDASETIRTRLSQFPVDIKFEPPLIGPFGDMVPRLTVPFYMLPPGDKWEKPDSVVVHKDGSGFKFRLADWEYVYDRFGLRRKF